MCLLTVGFTSGFFRGELREVKEFSHPPCMGGESTTHPCREEAGGVRQSPPRAEGGHAGKCERWAQGGGHGFGRLMREAGRTDTEAGHHACGRGGATSGGCGR